MRASRRCEAVWACETGVFAKVGPQNVEMYSGLGCVPSVFGAMCMVVVMFSHKSLLYVWSLVFFRVFACYVYRFFDWFGRQASISCYMCVCFFFCC